MTPAELEEQISYARILTSKEDVALRTYYYDEQGRRVIQFTKLERIWEAPDGTLVLIGADEAFKHNRG